MTKIAKIQARPYLQFFLLAKDMQKIMLRASDGENGSGDNQSFLCENCATPSRSEHTYKCVVDNVKH